MTLINDPNQMPEAEVSLRFAIALIEKASPVGAVEVGVDGAQVKIRDEVIFPIEQFLSENGWGLQRKSTQGWRGIYVNPALRGRQIRVHSNPGEGDVVATFDTGRRLIAECKKGPLVRSKSSQEYKLLREALGQLLTMNMPKAEDITAVAVVPDSEKFRELAGRWRVAPLVVKTGIVIATIGRNGNVDGLRLGE